MGCTQPTIVDGMMALIAEIEIYMKIITLEPVDLISVDAIIGKITDYLLSLNQRCDRLLIICEDVTRSTPIHLFFPQLLRFLQRYSSPEISVIFALGTHRPMTETEMLNKLGISPREAENINLLNHNAFDDSHLVEIGVIDGVTVKLNRVMINQDVVMCFGSVFPHRVVGFSGGTKYLCPGIANQAIIDYTHWKSNLFSTEEIMAKVDNPIRNILAQVGELATQAFPATLVSVNFVTLPAGIVDVCVGDLQSSYRQAAALSAKLFLKTVEPCDKLLAIVDDKSADFWQAAKAVYNCADIVRDGGILVVRGRLAEGISATHGDIINQFGYAIPEQVKKWVNSGELNNPLVASHLIRVGQHLQRIKVFLASEYIDEKMCDRINLGYRDPASLEPSEFDAIVYHATDLILRRK
ncbi:MAG: DUF2088 domain-containing protein [Arthrospira sp. SH-MAG29]|nr:lactate racemase domain-containing protein [Arthrospira sp. SH-MAG29]MBS0015920.1 DUF2088 domain-containing protein [Arthrospira sp. SH-MAG29]